jgi:hypothetical protein
MDPKVGSQIKSISKSQKMKTRYISPPVVPVKDTPTLRISSLIACNLLKDHRVIL